MSLSATAGLIGAGLVLAGVQLWVVATHPEPAADEPDADIKPRYAALVRPDAVALTLAVVASASAALGWFAPPSLWPAWLVWASAALVLVSVDARTTWLPIRSSVLTEVALAAAICAGAIIAGDVWLVVRAGVGAALAGGFFWLAWRISGALGFGDVRLAAMAGALAAMGSATWWFVALLGGTAASAIWGLVVTAWRRRHPSPLGKAFAYGPGLWLGPWLGWFWG